MGATPLVVGGVVGVAGVVAGLLYINIYDTMLYMDKKLNEFVQESNLKRDVYTTIRVSEALRDLIKMGAMYARKPLNEYLEDLVMHDLGLSDTSR